MDGRCRKVQTNHYYYRCQFYTQHIFASIEKKVTAENLLCCSYKYFFMSIICGLFFLQREFEISLMPFCVQNWSFCCCLYDKDITLKLRKRVLRGFQMVPQ